MSGGYFEYAQNHMDYIATDIEELIEENPREYDYATIEKFKEAVRVLLLAYTYAQRIDWLLSGDDSEEIFHKRLREDIDELQIRIFNNNISGVK
jgi:hypothetical protein